MATIMQVQRAFEYESWANALVNQSLRSAKSSLESGPGGAASEAPSLVKAVQIWAHTQLARRLWLSRLGRAEAPSFDQGWFPVWSLGATIKECEALDAMWAAGVGALDEAGLDTVAAYTTTEGHPASSSVRDILAHVVNHSTYHRGQIARLVAECGGTVAATDFILFARSNPPPGVARS
ncbi:MAG: DinB family protein [Phycisphaeraceae bacterium]|nr:DinB family protein [Phycisphaeraceae bacterium]